MTSFLQRIKQSSKGWCITFLVIVSLILFSACSFQRGSPDQRGYSHQATTALSSSLSKAGAQEENSLESFEDTAEWLVPYLKKNGHLPPVFITKKEARDAGWIASEGNLHEVLPGRIIGGDSFGNREKRLPAGKNKRYTECDLHYEGGFRTEDRLVFSSDGFYYVTLDHYESFLDVTQGFPGVPVP